MSRGEKISVAMPWSLSHYILLNGFHPLYRALVDHAPPSITLNAWDNVKLHDRLAGDGATREVVLDAAKAARHTARRSIAGPVSSAYQKYFWPPNQALTSYLAGDIEFHHTAPFPSMERPFVFHCESFAPVFLPLARQGGGAFKNPMEIREHYRRIFSNPLCLGIFSHIPETLESLRRFFSDPIIDGKLFGSKIGLSSNAFSDPDLPEKPALSRPRFLFVNSANQNTSNFFLRGGHLVLRFWKEFRTSGRDGLLILRCGRPDNADLTEYGVDVSFLSAEIGRSIIWAQDYLAIHEMNALMANAHFFLLPSASLHSVSIMQAMTLGAVPVVTDTIGTSVYVTDVEHGIVLQGMRSAIWHEDPNTGILVDSYSRVPALDEAIVAQLTRRVFDLLDAPDEYDAVRKRAMEHARNRFGGKEYSCQFWNGVFNLYGAYTKAAASTARPSGKSIEGLRDCTLYGDGWARVFESGTQPMRRIFTGQSTVTELGGAILHTYGNPEIELNDWSVMAQYWNFGAPPMKFVITVDELNGVYLNYSGEARVGIARKCTRLIGKILMPFPELYSFAAMVLKRLRRYHRHLVFRLAQWSPSVDDSKAVQQPTDRTLDEPMPRVPTLAQEGYYGFNIVHLQGQFYAILQVEGAFELEKIGTGHYSRSFSGQTMRAVQEAIQASLDADQAATSHLQPTGAETAR